MKFQIRSLHAPDDYAAVATLVNLIRSVPTTGEQLEDDESKIPPGQLHYNEEGELMGWDRPKWVAEDEEGQVIGYCMAWRAPWNEPGTINQILVVHPDYRGRGVGTALYEVLNQWATQIKASRVIDYMRETDEKSLEYARKRGFTMERHTFESKLDLSAFDRDYLFDTIPQVEQTGIQFITLTDEPGEASERKLHELYKVTHHDIPGFNEDFPWFEEWKKWSIELPGVTPERIHIAKDGDKYVGVVTLMFNQTTGAMYNEYTGVLPEYRGRRIALALKLLGLQTARRIGAPYLLTHNDSLNAPMLRINRDLLGFQAEPGNFKMVKKL